jgi:Domain of unknown function (DUF5979)
MIGLLRKARIPALIVAAALLAAGCIDVSVTKKTTGGESSGPFVVRVSCTDDDTNVTVSEDLTFTGDGQEQTTDFNHAFLFGAHCTVTEIESAGAASVTYMCDDINTVPADLGATCTESADGVEIVMPPCVVIEDSQSAGRFGAALGIGSECEVDASITVTNDFTPPPTPPPPTEPPTTAATPPPAPQAAPVVEAQPTFTG